MVYSHASSYVRLYLTTVVIWASSVSGLDDTIPCDLLLPKMMRVGMIMPTVAGGYLRRVVEGG